MTYLSLLGERQGSLMREDQPRELQRDASAPSHAASVILPTHITFHWKSLLYAICGRTTPKLKMTI